MTSGQELHVHYLFFFFPPPCEAAIFIPTLQKWQLRPDKVQHAVQALAAHEW